jgi:hypothetical protein
MVADACKSSTQEPEAGGSQVQACAVEQDPV